MLEFSSSNLPFIGQNLQLMKVNLQFIFSQSNLRSMNKTSHTPVELSGDTNPGGHRRINRSDQARLRTLVVSAARTRQKGVTLIESLVAVVVISIGMLGIAALQLTATSQNTSALHHSQAVWLAFDMSDRIRANMPAFEDYADINTSNDYTQNCQTTSCTPAQLVIADAADWKRLIERLPGGRGIISDNLDVGAPSNALTIAVMWDDEGTGKQDTGCGQNPQDDLTCYILTVSPPAI